VKRWGAVVKVLEWGGVVVNCWGGEVAKMWCF
jgi:hypothetical protein